LEKFEKVVARNVWDEWMKQCAIKEAVDWKYKALIGHRILNDIATS
jgi:hypothetical protein